MKRAFIRALWGDNTHSRREKVNKEVNLIMGNKNTVPFTTYIFGRENYNFFVSMGLNKNGYKCVLINENPVVWDLTKEFWRHKLDIFKSAMEDYDEIIYLDFDCVPISPVFENIWDKLGEKESIQANLQFYRNKKCFWRNSDFRKTSNGGFVYMRDNGIPDKLIKIWNGFDLKNRFWDEVCISKLTDDMVGGWNGIEKYWDLFEPEVCNLKKNSVFDADRIMLKKFCFYHFIQSANNKNGTEYVSTIIK
jgi:hypothetical protein